MSEKPSTVENVRLQLQEFKRFLAPDVAARLDLSNPYRVKSTEAAEAHRPTSYGKVFKNSRGQPIDPNAGVYLHVNGAGHVRYVGMSVSIGSRLGNYFQYDEDKTCKVIREDLLDTVEVYVLPFDEEIDSLMPALETFLIERLDPPVNKRGRWKRASRQKPN